MRAISTPDATDAYNTLAPFYDRFTAHHDYDLWTGGLLQLAYAHGLRGTRVLDAGCGTGKSFLPLLERGFEVTACDGSSAMLDVAASKAGDIANAIASTTGGKGGGRPHFASAGVGDPAKLGEARARTPAIIRDLAG